MAPQERHKLRMQVLMRSRRWKPGLFHAGRIAKKCPTRSALPQPLADEDAEGEGGEEI
jgi:hypothetical protein